MGETHKIQSNISPTPFLDFTGVTEFNHVTTDTLQTLKVEGSKVKVTA